MDQPLKSSREPSTNEKRKRSRGAGESSPSTEAVSNGGPPPRRQQSKKQRSSFHEQRSSNGSGTKLYVGNLDWSVAWQGLKDHFRSAGQVTRADVVTTDGGRSKGFGIVEYATPKQAQAAIQKFHQTDFQGRTIYVRYDNNDDDNDEKPRSSGRRAPGVGGSNSAASLYVGNLSYETSWQDLKDHFRNNCEGSIVRADVIRENNGRSKGFGIVEYATPREAKEAIRRLDGTEWNGRTMFVRYDQQQSSQSQHPSSQPRPPQQQQKQDTAGCSVFCSNLSYQTSWQDLKDHMRKAGNVDQADIWMDHNRRSKGLAVVTYQHKREAERAVRELNESVLDGRSILVKADNRGSSNSSGGGTTSVFVGNLDYDASWRDLKDYVASKLGDDGGLERVEVMEGPNGRKKGYGTVQFASSRDAERAIRILDGTEFKGRTLEVRLDKQRG